MERKDIQVEMQKVKEMVKNKIQKDVAFPPFFISYSMTGSKMIQLEKWVDNEEKDEMISNAVEWVKSELPYGVIFGSLATKNHYPTETDFKNGTNPEKVPAVIIVGKTASASYHLCLEYTEKDGKYTFEESFSEETGVEDNSFLGSIFSKVN